MHKKLVVNRMVNYIWLTCLLRTYKTCNSTVEFSKYEFNNKLLSGVTLLRIALSVTWKLDDKVGVEFKFLKFRW